MAFFLGAGWIEHTLLSHLEAQLGPPHTWHPQARDTPRLETLIQRLARYTWRLGTFEFPCDLHTPFPDAHAAFSPATVRLTQL